MQSAFTTLTHTEYFPAFSIANPAYEMLALVKNLAVGRKGIPLEIKPDCVFCLRLEFGFDDLS